MSAAAVSSACNTLRTRLPQARPRVAVVLGSGWGDLTQHVNHPIRIGYADLAGFPQPSVEGHASDLVHGHIGQQEVLLLTGRKHSYETGHAKAMVEPLRTLKALGIEVLVQTNAAGSVAMTMPTGSLMLIEDHLNLPQISPLIGEAGSERFVSMHNAYDAQLRAYAMQVASQQGLPLHQGVYAWFIGPQFETPAEIRMCQGFGAHAVGMSTVPETIIARHAGMRVLAFSLITNMAAGLSDEALSHAHTLNQAAAASQQAVRLLSAVIADLPL